MQIMVEVGEEDTMVVGAGTGGSGDIYSGIRWWIIL